MTTVNPRTHFVRILDYGQVRKMIDMLNTVSDKTIPYPPENEEFFNVHAPDGDVVFAGLKKGGRWICRLHREVFAENN
ncbi:hypothetical protein [Rhodosalinus sp.]|uniref:hypothetical protein n=1 Tax=Rhodosalinus sp. TaxID=2047741 RepID=UPI00397B7C8C